MTDLVQKLVVALTEICSLDPHESSTTEWNAALRKCDAALSEAKAGGWVCASQAPKHPVCQDGNNHYSEYILAWWPGAMAPTRCRWWFRDDSDACNFVADGGYAVFPTKWQPLPNPPKGEV